jgi:hypothetical protein
MKADVEGEPRAGSYRLETVPCCVCSGSDFEPLAGKDRYGFSCSVVICKACGLIQTNPRMDEKSFHVFYQHEYRKLYRGHNAPDRVFFQSQYEAGHRIFDYLAGASALFRGDAGGRLVLEIGCGAGAYRIAKNLHHRFLARNPKGKG